MAACAKCGATLAEGVTFCASCGTPVAAAGAAPAGGTAPAASKPAAAGSSGLTSNVAGALAYLTIIPAIIFLVAEPYKSDRFVRFHAFQCLFVAAGAFVVYFCLGIFALIPVVGWIVGLLLFPLVGLTIFATIVFSAYKAYNNEKFQIPVIGKLAEEQSSK
jgi:uncharacterized membrane protein